MSEQKKIRQEFADTMLEVGQIDPRLVVLIGDISHFALQPFAEACPGRFYNVGICEPTIVNMAAGLAKVGLYPVVHTIAPFIVERSLEQIKLDFGYQRLGVNLVTLGSAFDYAALGCTHHCYSDFAILKPIEGSQIVYPASAEEFNALFKQTYNNGLITYFRIPDKSHGVDIAPTQIVLGRGVQVQEGSDVTIVAVGSQLRTAAMALPLFQEQGISAEIIYIHTVKPLDVELVRASVLKTKKCIVIEEHSAYGGVFDDVLRATRDISHVEYFSLNIGESFIHEYGTYEGHCRRLGLNPENLVEQARQLVEASQVRFATTAS